MPNQIKNSNGGKKLSLNLMVQKKKMIRKRIKGIFGNCQINYLT